MWEEQLQAAIDAGIQAIDIAMNYYKNGFNVEIKEDKSPVTIADKTVDAFLRKTLSKKFPSYSFLTEESVDDKDRLNNDFVWIIDPIDGTKDFIAKDDEFTINIALCYKHKIVVGVVIAPALNEIYYASENNGAFFEKLGQKPVKMHVTDKGNN